MGKKIEIVFDASVYKVQSLADGGIRITLDMSGENIVQMGALAQCQMTGIVLAVMCTPAEHNVQEQSVVIDEGGAVHDDIDELIKEIDDES